MCLKYFINNSENSRSTKPFTCNRGYPKTRFAILKIVQAVFSLTAFLCAACAPWWTFQSFHAFQYFCFVCQFFMWLVVILFILKFLNLHHRSWWPIGEIVFYVLATLFYLTASISAAVFAANPWMVAATVLGMLCFLLFVIGIYVSYQEMVSPKQQLALPAEI